MSKNHEGHQPNAADAMKQMLLAMMPVAEIRSVLLSDRAFVDQVAENVFNKMSEDGYITDEIMSVTEVMATLGIKHPVTLKKMSKVRNGLKPIKLHDNAHPKYRKSDVTRYIKSR